MNGTKPKLIAWDSCIFLAWFKREEDKPLDEIKELLQRVEKQSLSMLVSAISLAEVLDKTGVSDAGTKFRAFVRRPEVVLANVDHRVGAMAGDIRIEAIKAAEEGRMKTSIRIPDALVAATAITYKAAELHTFDPVLLEASTLLASLSPVKIIRPEKSDPMPLGF